MEEKERQGTGMDFAREAHRYVKTIKGKIRCLPPKMQNSAIFNR
jgi:hypothetical protein